jgi:uncharacterized protein YacL
MKVNLKIVMKKVLLILLTGIIMAGVGYLIAMLISDFGNLKLTNVLCYEGLIVIVLGLFMSMRGNPTSINLSMATQQNAQYMAQVNFDAVMQEQKATQYHTDSKKNAVLELCFATFTLVLVGLVLLGLSVWAYYL